MPDREKAKEYQSQVELPKQGRTLQESLGHFAKNLQENIMSKG